MVGEVYGTSEGSKKRKRAEVTVGIDGEAVNIYNVSSAGLVTSYPIPPQSFFSCPPFSIRRRVPGSKEVVRHTYAAFHGPAKKITLFKDQIDPSGNTTSQTKTLPLASAHPVVYLAPRAPQNGKTGVLAHESNDEVLVVRQDGEMLGVNDETLEEIWKTSPAVMHRDLTLDSESEFRIEFCMSASVSDVIEGIFKGNRDFLSSLSVSSDGQDHLDFDILIAVSHISSPEKQARHLHLLGPAPSSRTVPRSIQGLVQLHVVPIPSSAAETDSDSSYRLDVRSGNLFELSEGHLSVYDLTASIPKISHNMELGDAVSFLRLSKTSVLASTPAFLDVYNPRFRSLQSSTPIDLDSQAQEISADKTEALGCSLDVYFSKLELAVGTYGSNLVAIRLEAPKTRAKKRRAEGLLIDSIGRGVPQPKRTLAQTDAHTSSRSSFASYLPGSMLGNYHETLTEDMQKADDLLASDQSYAFDSFLAGKFGLQVVGNQQINGARHKHQPSCEWQWPKPGAKYPRVDRRWIICGISRVFHWNSDSVQDASTPRLVCSLPTSQVFEYLVNAGHLTISNIKSALRDQLDDIQNLDDVLAEGLVTLLAEVDPALELLTVYISSTTVGSVELLYAIRTIMRSLELVQDPSKPPPKLLTNGVSGSAENGDSNGDFGMELDELEQEIDKTEAYLTENMGIRGSGLSAAFAKLGNCPAVSMIKALRSTLKPDEILSLVYLLRVELVKGAWTARYLDDTEYEKDAELEPPPDGIIKLIAELLGRCVDAIGPSGWLLNDAILSRDDSGDFIAHFKMEVSAALEGLEEAVYLRGILGEAVKYCEAVQKIVKRENKAFNASKPITLQVKEPGAEALPLGLKTKETVDAKKVVSGGEVIRRSARERGHLLSRQVGPYSLERITI